MHRRKFLGSVATAMVSTASLARADGRGAEVPSSPPNIVFFFSDQQRWDSVDCYGSPIFPGLTPNLDRMAREGVRFERAFTPQPVCGPARSCIQTGRYATETGCFRNGIPLPPGERTIAHCLSDAGYEVGYIGKWHLASDTRTDSDFFDAPVPPELRGGWRDYWLASDVLEFTSHSYDGHMYDADMRRVEFPPDRYRADCLTDYALEYLGSRDRERPFFLMVSYIEPHHQNDHKHFEGPRGSKERYRDYHAPGDLPPGKGDWEAEMPDYLGCIASLDENLGRVRAELARLGMAENTLLVYATDHGCHFHTREGEYKRTCHEAAIRIPMLAVGPGFEGGRVVHEMVDLLDLPPTFVTAGGATPPGTMRGRPLQELMGRKRPDGWREDHFLQTSEAQTGRALRTDRWKYSVRADRHVDAGGADEYTEEFLYDLPADPHELTNLVREPELASVRAELARRLMARMAAADETRPTIRSAPA